jgi:hypothetical protein
LFKNVMENKFLAPGKVWENQEIFFDQCRENPDQPVRPWAEVCGKFQVSKSTGYVSSGVFFLYTKFENV